MEGDQVLDVYVGSYVGNAISVRQQERPVVQVLGDPLDAPSGYAVQPGVDDRDAPGLGSVDVNDDLVPIGEVERHTGLVEELVGEIRFDDVLFEARANYKLTKAMMGIPLHDVPRERPVAGRDHRVGTMVGSSVIRVPKWRTCSTLTAS